MTIKSEDMTIKSQLLIFNDSRSKFKKTEHNKLKIHSMNANSTLI